VDLNSALESQPIVQVAALSVLSSKPIEGWDSQISRLHLPGFNP
jgi:hypothetical protein